VILPCHGVWYWHNIPPSKMAGQLFRSILRVATGRISECRVSSISLKCKQMGPYPDRELHFLLPCALSHGMTEQSWPMNMPSSAGRACAFDDVVPPKILCRRLWAPSRARAQSTWPGHLGSLASTSALIITVVEWCFVTGLRQVSLAGEVSGQLKGVQMVMKHEAD
jgi:hypothetical protein